MQDLELWFTKAGLPIKLEKNPIHSIILSINSKDIFQMIIDTEKNKKKKEIFKIFPGDKNNDVRVIDINQTKRQVILLVNEPEREYTVRRWNRKRNDFIYEKQKSPNFLRKYLMGMDESHLFISELPNDLGTINKIKDAHQALKPLEVIKNKTNTNRIKRQGEWFFIPVTQKELTKIKENLGYIEKKRSLGKFGGRSRNSHVADLVLTIKEGQFAKGKISHIDHKTLKLHGWFKVVPNNQKVTWSISGQAIYNGVNFVD